MLALTHFVLPSLSFLTQTFDDDTGIPFRTWPRRQSTDYAGNQPESYRQTCTDRPRQDTSRFHPLSQINFFFLFASSSGWGIPAQGFASNSAVEIF
jgi:hypothetical protein